MAWQLREGLSPGFLVSKLIPSTDEGRKERLMAVAVPEKVCVPGFLFRDYFHRRNTTRLRAACVPVPIGRGMRVA